MLFLSPGAETCMRRLVAYIADSMACVECRIRHVVFDEADLLLSGSFQKDITRIMQALQDADRARKITATSCELGVSEEQYRALPVHLRRAGIAGGCQAAEHDATLCSLADMTGWSYKMLLLPVATAVYQEPCLQHAFHRQCVQCANGSSMRHALHSCLAHAHWHSHTYRFIAWHTYRICTPAASQCSHGAGGAAAMKAAGLKPKHLSGKSSPVQPDAASENVWDDQPHSQPSMQSAMDRSSSPVSTSQPQSEPYWRRQYIFAAATMPTGGCRTWPVSCC